MQALQAVLLIAASIALVVIAAAFAVLVRGALRELQKIGQASEDLSSFLKATEDELAPTIRNARSAVSNIDRLIASVTETAEKIDRIAGGAERLFDGTYVGSTAARAVKSASAGLLSVYEGVRQGIRTLRGPNDTDKGGKTNEQ